MKNCVMLMYGIFAYGVGLGSILFMMGWLGNFIPKSIDSTPVSRLGEALLINFFVFAAFGIQHSVMARPAFKAWWTKVIPEAAERSTYVLFSGVAMLLLMFSWQPLGGAIWSIDYQPARCILHTLYFAGWGILFGSTFALNHFDLFGLRQVWFYFHGKPYEVLQFKTPGPYRFVRHPLYVGWLMLAWATPDMTLAHLGFAVMTTAYILIAIRWEERDLVNFHGDDYIRYQAKTPMLIPSLSTRESSKQADVLSESASA
ncbi:MAG: methanethiol S-methyltransferase [Pirellulaceae bacterium]